MATIAIFGALFGLIAIVSALQRDDDRNVVRGIRRILELRRWNTRD